MAQGGGQLGRPPGGEAGVQDGSGFRRYTVLAQIHAKGLVEPPQYERPRPDPGPPPDDPEGAGKPPRPRLPSARSRTDSLVRPTRWAMSLTDTRSWSTRTAKAVGTALATGSS